MKKRFLSRLGRYGVVALLVACMASRSSWAQFLVEPPLAPSAVAVVVNEQFPGSVDVGEYYLHARRIPARNLIRLSFPVTSSRFTAEAFDTLRQKIESQLDSDIRVILFVWTSPYAVECNSLTGAFTLGFQGELCRSSCDSSRPNPYFNRRDNRGLAASGQRLSMLLPVESVDKALLLIDRGVAADARQARGRAFFLKTGDVARSSRAVFFPKSTEILRPAVSVRNLEADSIESENDIILYHTGAVTVPYLDTLRFLPGAIADHLTSTGGDLLGTSQMSILRWLDAGATGSYGTVSEPCNHWQKFPHSSILLGNYLSGATLIESYWRSVAWPGQGLFIGEPLAAPYRRQRD